MLRGKQFFMSGFALILLFICNVSCNKNNTENENNNVMYAGEYFPDKYLEDDVAPTVNDLNIYIDGLTEVINYWFSENYNKTTDINKALSIYLMRGILKRTIMDYWEVLTKHQYETLLDILYKSHTLWSYFLASVDDDFLKDFSSVLNDPMTLAHSIGDFKSNSFRKWIKTHSSINTFLEDMDKKILSKKEYARLQFLFLSDYHIRIPDSDFCLREAVSNPEPINSTEKIKPCKPNPYCYEAMSSEPSVAYTLSHRIVTLLIYRMTRRCYFDANDQDEVHIERLCAQMYRESVYIARRGFFARDMFMEHVGLCAMMGYKEFFRRNWFNKMTSWIDEEGCIAENYNFAIERVAYIKSVAAKVNLNVDEQFRNSHNACAVHLMAVYTFSIASAIREAAHNVASSRVSQLQKIDPYWVSPLEKIKHI